jgi:glycosyltransferase involved in cell wall biosynthesis
VRLGIIARADDRGLGNQTWEACKHLEPARVLVVEPPHDKRFTQHLHRYDPYETTHALWTSGRLDEATCRRWLRGLDAVYTAETWYDVRFAEWARSEGVRLVVHANPEFLAPQAAAQPVVWWAPTPWRLEHLPPTTRVVPMPVPVCPLGHQPPSDKLRFLHVAGWPTVGDRNGTEIVADAAMRIAFPCEVTIRGQHSQLGETRRHRRLRRSPVRLTFDGNGVADYWSLYHDADVIVMPRRFGGLCLPVQEAMSAGLATVMTDCSPNEVWPGLRVPARVRGSVRAPGGNIPMHDVDPHHLAEVMGELAANRDLVAELQRQSRQWAEANTWAALRPMWTSELEAACQ